MTPSPLLLLLELQMLKRPLLLLLELMLLLLDLQMMERVDASPDTGKYSLPFAYKNIDIVMRCEQDVHKNNN